MKTIMSRVVSAMRRWHLFVLFVFCGLFGPAYSTVFLWRMEIRLVLFGRHFWENHVCARDGFKTKRAETAREYGAPNQSIFPTFFYGLSDFLHAQLDFLYGQHDFLYGQLFTFYIVNTTFHMVN